VGRLGQTIGEEALRAGMPADSVRMVESNAEATELLLTLIAPAPSGDVILVKGSRGLAMEEIVTALQLGRIL
jgi:UDP-N-acetylmuramyl pentapeptide synthase